MPRAALGVAILLLLMVGSQPGAAQHDECRRCKGEAFRQIQGTDRLRYNELCGPDQPSKANACKEFMSKKISGSCVRECGR